MKALLLGFYATRISLPLSGLSRTLRRFSRRLRNKETQGLQQVGLPDISWRQCTDQRMIRVWEHQKRNGNIRLSELAVISAIAAKCAPASNLFEIGTFDGRTTLNLALSAPSGCTILTLDLPPTTTPRFELAPGEEHMVEKPESGARYRHCQGTNGDRLNTIKQLYGDSAEFDFSPYYASCSLIFVDGSHAYDYAMSDSLHAMQLVRKNGIIIWHDYGIWEGVTRALEELEKTNGFGLKNIAGTSLVYWKRE